MEANAFMAAMHDLTMWSGGRGSPTPLVENLIHYLPLLFGANRGQRRSLDRRMKKAIF